MLLYHKLIQVDEYIVKSLFSFLDEILIMNKIMILAGAILLISGCSSKPNVAQPAIKINPEVLGSWIDDNGCSMSIDLIDKELVLREFSNSHGVNYTNVDLQWTKQSVFTVFSSTESDVKFSGSFSDGFITIDNGVCSKILHKDGTK